MNHDDKLREAIGNHLKAIADCGACEKALGASEERQVAVEEALVAAIKASGCGGVVLDRNKYRVDESEHGDSLIVDKCDVVFLSPTKPERKSP